MYVFRSMECERPFWISSAPRCQGKTASRQVSFACSSRCSGVMHRLALLLCGLLLSVPCLAQTPADLFNDNFLHEIRLEVHPHDWEQLKAKFYENTFYAA